MNLPDLSKNPALWLGLRQTEAIRQSLTLTLAGKPLPNQGVRETPADCMRSWLKTQNVPALDDGVSNEPLLFLTLSQGFEQGFGISPDHLLRGGNAPFEEWNDLGAERSGTGWKNPANFLITSAFVRLLGASEQFEMDVLKALIYYRPSGLPGHESEWIEQVVERDVIREIPVPDKEDKNKLVYSKPLLWTWLRKPAENNSERSRILKNVFGVNPIPDGYTGKNKDDWYDKRNAIAHGRSGVEMTLGEYIDVDVFVAKSMINVSYQCKEKLKLMV